MWSRTGTTIPGGRRGEGEGLSVICDVKQNDHGFGGARYVGSGLRWGSVCGVRASVGLGMSGQGFGGARYVGSGLRWARYVGSGLRWGLVCRDRASVGLGMSGQGFGGARYVGLVRESNPDPRLWTEQRNRSDLLASKSLMCTFLMRESVSIPIPCVQVQT